MNKNVKKCTICLTEKSLDDFYIQYVKNSDGEIIKTYCRPACKNCANRKQLKYSTAWKNKVGYSKEINKQRLEKRSTDDSYRELINSQKRKTYRGTLNYQLYSRARQRALAKNIDFDINPEDIIIPEFCPYLNIKLEVGNKNSYIKSPSIDRIDITKGYIKGNIQIISMLANTMKSSASIEQLIFFAKSVLKIHDKDDIVQPISKDIEI
jgi:hypothetical protein